MSIIRLSVKTFKIKSNQNDAQNHFYLIKSLSIEGKLYMEVRVDIFSTRGRLFVSLFHLVCLIYGVPCFCWFLVGGIMYFCQINI